MRAGIVGLGEWIPETIRTNDHFPPELAATHAARAGGEFTTIPVDDATESDVDRLVRDHVSSEANDPFLGTRARRVAPPEMTAHAAEALAAKDALRDANLDGAEIDVVLSSSAVPDRLTPPSAAYVANAIGARRARAFGADAVCASALAQLELAAALVESGRACNVLLTQSHLMTRAFPLMHPAAPNVGDGATAIVVSRVKRGGLRGIHVRTSGEYFDAVVWRRPKEADTPWWTPGGAMAMGSYDSERAREVIRDTVRIGAETVSEALAAAGVAPNDVQLLASVQPRKWVPSCVAFGAKLGDVAVDTFRERAHLGPCGIVANLLAARKEGRLTRGVCVVLYAQGAGLTRGGAVLEWSDGRES